jgi:hypothetical protein
MAKTMKDSASVGRASRYGALPRAWDRTRGVRCDLPGCAKGLRPSGGVCSWCAGRGSYSVRALAHLLRISPTTLGRVLDPTRRMHPETAAGVLERVLRLQQQAGALASVEEQVA